MKPMTTKEKIDDMIDILDAQRSLFSEFERKFIESVNLQIAEGKTLSEKQVGVVDSIYTKVCEKTKDEYVAPKQREWYPKL